MIDFLGRPSGAGLLTVPVGYFSSFFNFFFSFLTFFSLLLEHRQSVGDSVSTLPTEKPRGGAEQLFLRAQVVRGAGRMEGVEGAARCQLVLPRRVAGRLMPGDLRR